jgi:hypothetical protein
MGSAIEDHTMTDNTTAAERFERRPRFLIELTLIAVALTLGYSFGVQQALSSPRIHLVPALDPNAAQVSFIGE